MEWKIQRLRPGGGSGLHPILRRNSPAIRANGQEWRSRLLERKSVVSFALSPFRLLNKLLIMLRPADGFLADGLHDFAVSVVNDDVRSLDELLSNATEAQASQKKGGHSMVQSDANRDRLDENPGDEIGGARRRTNSSKGR